MTGRDPLWCVPLPMPRSARERVTVQPRTITPGGTWLSAAGNRSRMWADWGSERQLAFVPVGNCWDAVRLCARRLAVAMQVHPPMWERVPVLIDSPRGTAVVLTSMGTADTWRVQGTEACGPGTWLVASLPGGVQREGGWWLSAPGPSPWLMRPEDLQTALRCTTPGTVEAETYTCRPGLGEGIWR